MKNTEKVVEHVAGLVMDVANELEANPFLVPVGISARHVHLTKEAVSILFGSKHSLTFFKKLSQPGQFAANEQVQIIGPTGSISKVRVLGPERLACQIEIAYSDSRTLGIIPPVRSSGDIEGTPGIRLVGPEGEVTVDAGVIVAERHIHMSLEDAKWFGVTQGQQVKIDVLGPKAGIMEKVTVRIDKNYRLDLHIDTDDANAFLIRQGEKLRLIK
ncbi:MAG: phosphate propanoyltransferase [Velocimicrobium sp.]